MTSVRRLLIRSTILNPIRSKKLHRTWFNTRLDYFCLSIYTTHPEEVLQIIADSDIMFDDKPVMNCICFIDIMEPETLTYLRKPVEDSYKSSHKLCKRLPYNKYRYKIYWATQHKDKRAIGTESMSAISMQLSHCDQIRFTKQLANEFVRTYTSWHATYFYATDLDWIAMINLIDHRFIKKIEVYKMENEIE